MTPERAAAIERFHTEHAERLLAALRHTIGGDRDVHEDALQFAWHQLLRNEQVTLDDRGAGWLFTVARREALHQLNRHQHEVGVSDPQIMAPSRAHGADPAQIVAARHQFAELGRLPKRQRRLLGMHASGHTYEEISDRTGDSARTVDRQLRRARATARTIAREYGDDLKPPTRKAPEQTLADPDLDLSL